MTEQKRQQAVRLFMVVLALTALANGLGNNIFSNYFKCLFPPVDQPRGPRGRSLASTVAEA
mgnify:CR=1 FL=1